MGADQFQGQGWMHGFHPLSVATSILSRCVILTKLQIHIQQAVRHSYDSAETELGASPRKAHHLNIPIILDLWHTYMRYGIV